MTRRSVLTPRVVALALLALALAVSAVILKSAVAPPPAPISPPLSPPNAAPAAAAPVGPAALASAQQLMPTGARKLAAPPAGLPVYEGATLMLGYEQGDGPLREQTAVYSVAEPDASKVLAFYAAELERRGYRRSPAGVPTQPLSAMYQNEHAVVLLHLRQMNTGTRLSLIVRYTK